jgi:hypothetical protein
MYSPFSDLILAVAIHGIKNKTLINKLETYWVTEELSLHGQYSPFMLEVQKNQDLKANFWSLRSCVLAATGQFKVLALLFACWQLT